MTISSSEQSDLNSFRSPSHSRPRFRRSLAIFAILDIPIIPFVYVYRRIDLQESVEELLDDFPRRTCERHFACIRAPFVRLIKRGGARKVHTQMEIMQYYRGLTQGSGYSDERYRATSMRAKRRQDSRPPHVECALVVDEETSRKAGRGRGKEKGEPGGGRGVLRARWTIN